MLTQLGFKDLIYVLKYLFSKNSPIVGILVQISNFCIAGYICHDVVTKGEKRLTYAKTSFYVSNKM